MTYRTTATFFQPGRAVFVYSHGEKEGCDDEVCRVALDRVLCVCVGAVVEERFQELEGDCSLSVLGRVDIVERSQERSDRREVLG
jgi:hypothetical protein